MKIYMTEFNRKTMRSTSSSIDCGFDSFEMIEMVYGSNFISKSPRMMIYHVDDGKGLTFTDHTLFSVDRVVNNDHTEST